MDLENRTPDRVYIFLFLAPKAWNVFPSVKRGIHGSGLTRILNKVPFPLCITTETVGGPNALREEETYAPVSC